MKTAWTSAAAEERERGGQTPAAFGDRGLADGLRGGEGKSRIKDNSWGGGLSNWVKTEAEH